MGTPAQILVVDDEPNIRLTLQMVLEGEGWEVTLAPSAEEALARLAEESVDAVVMISGHATPHDAVSATRAGAFDFLEKPRSRERVLVTVRNALRESSRGRELADLKARAGRDYAVGGLFGDAPALVRPRRTRPVRAGRRAVRGGQLRGHPGRAHRVHALRPREGRLHRRGGPAARPVRARRWRHALPGRDRRHEPLGPGQGAARAPVRRAHARRQRIGLDDLPDALLEVPERSVSDEAALAGEGNLRDLRDVAERRFIVERLDALDWNISRAADSLGLERTHLHK